MTYDWTALQRSAAVEQLMSERRYREALRLLRQEAARRPADDALAMQIADAYAVAGLESNAVQVLRALTNHLAAHGPASRAIAALKKLQKLDPSQEALYESVAAALQEEETGGSRFVIPLDDAELDIGGLPDEAPAPGPDAPSMRLVDEAAAAAGIPSSLFDDFSQQELLAVMRGLELLVFDPGDIIVAQGEAGDSIFILTSGIAKAFVRQPGGVKKVRTLHDGDFFGEISLLHGGERTATVTAATRCELLELDRPTLDVIAAAHPRVREVLQRFADERLASDRAGE
jgi:hypothetical protein